MFNLKIGIMKYLDHYSKSCSETLPRLSDCNGFILRFQTHSVKEIFVRPLHRASVQRDFLNGNFDGLNGAYLVQVVKTVTFASGNEEERENCFLLSDVELFKMFGAMLNLTDFKDEIELK